LVVWTDVETALDQEGGELVGTGRVLNQEDIVPTNMKDAIGAVKEQAADHGTAASTDPITARTPCGTHPT
jgi:hypothetical protein